MAFYINLGTNIDAGWTAQIATSQDNKTWSTINARNLTLKPSRPVAGEPPLAPDYLDMTITLVDNANPTTPILQFKVSSVSNQPTWTTGTLTGLYTAIDDISTWIATAIAVTGGGGGSVTIPSLTEVDGDPVDNTNLLNVGGKVINNDGSSIYTVGDSAKLNFDIVGQLQVYDRDANTTLAAIALNTGNTNTSITTLSQDDDVALTDTKVLMIAARAVDQGSFGPTYTVGDAAYLNIQIDTGELLVTDLNVYNETQNISLNLSDLTSVDNAALTSNNSRIVGGKAVDTATYAPAYSAGDAVIFAFDKDNGGLLVNQANLDEAEDDVTVYIKTTSTSTGAPDAYRNASLVNTAQAVKASAGNLYGWSIRNNSGSAVYVKFCDTASGSTTPGTTAVVFSLMVPANGSIYQAPNCVQHNFATAITAYACTGFLDNDATTPGADNVLVELKYK